MTTPDLTGATRYHYGEFPPQRLDYGRLLVPVGEAHQVLGRFDNMLNGMQNSSLLLNPLRQQEAVVSSRIEGTITTLDEVLKAEADQQDDATDLQAKSHRNATLEVMLFARAMTFAQDEIAVGTSLSDRLVRSAHEILMRFVHRPGSQIGVYKTEQNYLGDTGKVSFVPINPTALQPGLDALWAYAKDENQDPLIQTALTHVEFESLHPFKDGNGRIGRMLIPLQLWSRGVLSAPHFYISAYFDTHRDTYIDSLRAVSRDGDWTNWCLFFLEALKKQSGETLATISQINALYEALHARFRDTLRSAHYVEALNFLFSMPIFWNSQFIQRSGIPAQTASRFTRILVKENLLQTLVSASGRRPAFYRFTPLMDILDPLSKK